MAAGLGKLGQGIEGALGDIAAKRKAAQEAIANANTLAASSPVFRRPIAALGAGNAPANPAPSFSPVGEAGDIPLFARPGAGSGQAGGSIGAGGSLPTLAQNGPGAATSDPRLLNYIYGEAGNQGYQGQLAVANVLANRAAQNFRGYGTTLEDQATKGTGIFGSNSEFNGYKAAPASAAEALQKAIANSSSDVTGGALFFANPSGSTAAWARNLTPENSLKIGDHYFTNNTNGIPISGSPAQTATAAPTAPPPNIIPNTPSAGQSVIPGQGDPHQPGFDPSSVPFHRTPEMDQQQGMLDPQQSQADQLAAALAGQGDPNAPQMSPEIVALLNGDPFGLGGMFG